MSANDDSLSKGQKTQQKVIEAALKLYGEHGVNQTSIQMIADACELSQGAVMQHFKSKARLFEAVRSHVSASNHQFIDKKISPMDDALSALHKHMLGNLEWALKYRAQASIIYLTYEGGIYDEDQRSTAQAAARLGSERILRYLYSAQREKLIPQLPHLEERAMMLQEYLLGMVLRALNEVTSNKPPSNSVTKIDLILATLLESKPLPTKK
jgi:AcrR family transcriptional regulator